MAKWLVLAIYVATVTFLAAHHEPWYDEYHVWDMVYRMSFSDLVASMRAEGHFCLWHLCVLPWVKFLGMDYHALFVVSIILMTVAVWLILFKVDFPFTGKLFVIFSAPFIYHFPVIARCYALIPPICTALVAVYQRKSNPFLYCFLIGLLAHTHAYMEGLVAILWIVFLYRYVIQLWNSDRSMAIRNLKASSVTVLLVLLAFLQIAGSVVDAGNNVGPAFKNNSDDSLWLNYFYLFHKTRIFHSLHCRIPSIPNLDLGITLLIYCAISFMLWSFIHKCDHNAKRDFIWIILIGSIWQILFSINIYYMYHQRVYLVCIPLLIAIGFGIKKNLYKPALLITVLFWLVNTPCQYVIAKDILQKYSFDPDCASKMDEIIPENSVIFSTREITSVLLMRRNIQLIEAPPRDTIIPDSWYKKLDIQDNNDNIYLVARVNLDITPDSLYKFTPIYKGMDGNSEIAYIPWDNPVVLYKLEKNEKNN